MGRCPMLRTLSVAVDPVKAAALLGNVCLSSRSIAIASDCSKATQIFYKVCFIYLFKLNITETLLDGFSLEDLNKTSIIPLF